MNLDIGKQSFCDKIYDNTITDEEISEFEKNFENMESYQIYYFQKNFSTLILKDEVKSISVLNTFKLRMPTFISTFTKKCLFIELDHCYIKNGVENATFKKNLTKVINFLISNNFIDLQYIYDILNDDSNDNINFFFAYDLMFDYLPDMRERYPSLAQKIEVYHDKVDELINESDLCLDVAWPSVVDGDSSNPRICKFGGVQPFLPNEGYTLCSKCKANCSMICQIYIPSTPEWFQQRFPLKYRDSLLVVFYCNTCYLSVETKFYTSDQFDSLVYFPDVVYNGNYCFNEPKIVTGWKSGKMLPISGNYIINTIGKNYFNGSTKFIEYFNSFNYENGPKAPNLTYIGGWPEFTQSDCTPKNSFLVINLSQSSSSTAMWGDCGTAQVWAKNPEGSYFGDFISDWACY